MSPTPSFPALGRLRQGLGHTELRVLAALLALPGIMLLFLWLTGEVKEGDTNIFDKTVLLAFRRAGDLARPIGPRWLQEAARDVTALGGFTVLTLITLLAATLLVTHRRRTQARVFVCAVILGQVLSAVVKLLVSRPRPDIVPHLDLVYASSFPSGHSAMSPVVYLTLAGIVAAGEMDRASKLLLLTLAPVLVAAIGVSRIYLGVHWPTDVLAGWSMGTAVALLATLILHWLAPHHRTRGAVAPDEPPPEAATASAEQVVQ